MAPNASRRTLQGSVQWYAPHPLLLCGCMWPERGMEAQSRTEAGERKRQLQPQFFECRFLAAHASQYHTHIRPCTWEQDSDP